MERVAGKVALITGAGRGQGRSHAVRLAEEGADVVITDVCRDISDEIPVHLATKDDLEETAAMVRATGRRCVALVADVRDHDQLVAAVEAAYDELGGLDIVVANAGVLTFGKGWELSESSWDVVMDVNLKGAWNTIRAAAPRMIAAGQGGSIVLISSTAGLRGHVGYVAYTASKHGVVGLMRAMSNELAGHQIRVNTVHPTGVSDTGIVPADREAPGGALRAMDGEPAMARLLASSSQNTIATYVEPRDISNAVLFLASDEARYVTGLEFAVDAGSTTKP